MKGWECPRCRRCYAPVVPECRACPLSQPPPTWTVVHAWTCTCMTKMPCPQHGPFTTVIPTVTT